MSHTHVSCHASAFQTRRSCCGGKAALQLVKFEMASTVRPVRNMLAGAAAARHTQADSNTFFLPEQEVLDNGRSCGLHSP